MRMLLNDRPNHELAEDKLIKGWSRVADSDRAFGTDHSKTCKDKSSRGA